MAVSPAKNGQLVVLDPDDLKRIRESSENCRGYYLMAQLDPDALLYWPVWVLPDTPSNIHVVTGFITSRTESRSNRWASKMASIRIVPYLFCEDPHEVTALIKDSVGSISLRSYCWIKYFLGVTCEEVFLFDDNGDDVSELILIAKSDAEYADIRRTGRSEFKKVIAFYGGSKEEVNFLSKATGMSIWSFLIRKQQAGWAQETGRPFARKPLKHSQEVLSTTEYNDGELSGEEIARAVQKVLAGGTVSPARTGRGTTGRIEE